MSKFITALKKLLPPGKAWYVPIGGDHDKFIQAHAAGNDRLEAFISSILDESIPSTCDNLLAEWTDIFKINPELPEETIKNLALTYYTSTGNQSPAYIEDQLLKTGFEVDLIEKDYGQSACGVAITGIASCNGQGILVFVVATLTPDEEAELIRLIDYYKPLHIGVIYAISRSTGSPSGYLQFTLGLSTLGRT